MVRGLILFSLHSIPPSDLHAAQGPHTCAVFPEDPNIQVLWGVWKKKELKSCCIVMGGQE